MDYTLSARHKVEGVYSYFKETGDRTNIDFVSPNRPLVFTDSDTKRFSLAWRWMKSANFQNELRGGANLAPVRFESAWDNSSAILYNTALSITNPIGGNGTSTGFQPQGRYTNTYQIGDSASLLRGRHDLQMGGLAAQPRQPVRLRQPISGGDLRLQRRGASERALTSAEFQGGISAAELANANALASWLGGIVSSVGQTFQVENQTPG